jgi:hypothetical protein
LHLHRARFMLFDTVYTHRVVVLIDDLMVEILRELLPVIRPDKDGDDVIYHRDHPQRVKELVEKMETRAFKTDTRVKRKTGAHYGAGELNPLDLVRFEPPVTDEWKEVMLPRRFNYVKE